MAGYLNRFIDLGFPDLAGVDDNGRALCWVKIRNPRLSPAGDFAAAAAKVRIENGQPVQTDLAASETFASFAKLIIAGHVWDASWTPTVGPDGSIDDTEEPPLLPMPPSADDVAKMPMDILNAIGEELKRSAPR